MKEKKEDEIGIRKDLSQDPQPLQGLGDRQRTSNRGNVFTTKDPNHMKNDCPLLLQKKQAKAQNSGERGAG